ncbi:MAG: aldehyde ferredoxin oxidoreductase family protein [Desulfovibrionaceae bacterium]
MHGSHGRILSIDCTSRTFAIRPTPDAVFASLLGGKGLATRLLLDENPPGVDPLGPDNRLIFATGPLCHSPLWGASRYGVFTKSPLTGLYCESYSGGATPQAVDATGFDAIILHGAASAPTALSIHPDGCAFHDAAALWGMDTYEAEEEAIARFGLRAPGYCRPRAVVIGPAGENLVRCAIIANDRWRCAGRAGVGAVMGAKRVKAVVFQGGQRRPLADPDGVAAFARAMRADSFDAPSAKAFRGMGTTGMVSITNAQHTFPTRYWAQGQAAHWERVNGETLHREHTVAAHACPHCFMACGRHTTIQAGRHAGLTMLGPEYETLFAFGGLCMVADVGEITWLNDLCDRLGLDTISAGNLCAFAMEAAAQGKLDIPLAWGDAEATAALLRGMAVRSGPGAMLADGIVPAARALGMEDTAVHVKGLDLPGYDPRVLKGMGLTYAISPRGACHLRATVLRAELSGQADPAATEGKAALVIDFEDRHILFDTLILCRFFRDIYTWEPLGQAIALATGLDGSRAAIQAMAGRISAMTRRFNIREGWTPAMDRLPARLTREALPSGHAVTEAEVAAMVREYYALRGWSGDGVPLGA